MSHIPAAHLALAPSLSPTAVLAMLYMHQHPGREVKLAELQMYTNRGDDQVSRACTELEKAGILDRINARTVALKKAGVNARENVGKKAGFKERIKQVNAPSDTLNNAQSQSVETVQNPGNGAGGNIRGGSSLGLDLDVKDQNQNQQQDQNLKNIVSKSRKLKPPRQSARVAWETVKLEDGVPTWLDLAAWDCWLAELDEPNDPDRVKVTITVGAIRAHLNRLKQVFDGGLQQEQAVQDAIAGHWKAPGRAAWMQASQARGVTARTKAPVPSASNLNSDAYWAQARAEQDEYLRSIGIDPNGSEEIHV